MIISAKHELYVLFGSAVGGMIIGMIFDVFKMCTAGKKSNVIFMGIGDLLLWSLVSIAVFAIIFILNDARVRWYEFAGMILGMIIYFMTLSKFFIKLMTFSVHTIKSILMFLFKIAMFPIKLVIKICSPLAFFAKKRLRVVKRIYKKALFKIRNLSKRIRHMRSS